MKIKIAYIKELSLRIKILELTKVELSGELKALSSSVTELSYRSWVLETFIVGIGSVFESILSVSGSTRDAKDLKNILYNRVIKVNPLLNPENLYIDSSNLITFNKTDNIKLTTTTNWCELSDRSNLMLLNFNEYSEVSEHVRGFDHVIETHKWDLTDMWVKVRVFDKSLREILLVGLDPKTEDDIKYFVVITCIDSFYHLCTHILNQEHLDHISFDKLIYSLYDIAVQYNSFMDITLKDVEKINKETAQLRHGSTLDLDDEKSHTSKKKLSDLTKKEVVALEGNILNRLFGHTEAVTSICNSVKRAHLGLKLANRPIGAFLLYGPTSTGKTELAKALAECLIKSPKGLVKIACNTLQGSHTMHTLIGAPPGYVGYEDKGILSSALKNSKFKILLFDEIDKAHPKLYDLLLEMLEEGQILTSCGEIIDVQECLIILTSNIGQSEALRATNTVGFETTDNTSDQRKKLLENQFKKAIKDKIKPEFLARLNGIFYFPELSDEDLSRTAELHINKYSSQCSNKFKLEYTPEVPLLILNKCRDNKKEKFHARDIRDFVDLQIIQKIGDLLIEKESNLKSVEKVTIDTLDNEFIFNIAKKTKAKK